MLEVMCYNYLVNVYTYFLNFCCAMDTLPTHNVGI